MKILLCNDLLLESVCGNICDVNLSHDWQELRNDKFLEMIDTMEKDNISYMVALGGLFSKEYVSEKAMDSFFDVVNEHKNISFLVVLEKKEYVRISYRKDVPSNLHILQQSLDDKYYDGELEVTIVDNDINCMICDSESFVISSNDNNEYFITGLQNGEKIIPHFEATGYEDLKYQFGYSIIEYGMLDSLTYSEVNTKKFSYKAMELTITPKNSQDEIIEYLLSKISEFEYETILHINFVGKVAFASLLDKQEIINVLQNKIFYVDITDNTLMAIDEKAFMNDISLKSEFVRTILHDNSFEDVQRNKILCYGCNALAGKEIHVL